MDLLEKSSILLTPTAYNNGEALCVKPSDGSGDFDFSRNSAATRVNAQGLVENVQILSSNLVQNPSFSEEGVQEVSNGSFSQEGSELITNGDFSNGSTDWTLGTGWSVSGGKASSDGSPSNLYQSGGAFLSGKTYKVVYDVLDYVSGDIRFRFTGTSNENGTLRNANGTYTEYIKLTNTQSVLVFPSSEFTGSIDNVSVKEVAADWTLGTGWSIGEDKASKVSGVTSYLLQPMVLPTPNTYKVTFTVSDYVSGDVKWGFSSTATSPFGTPRTANGTYTEYFTHDSNTIALRFRASSTFEGSITNISVKEVGMDWSLGSDWGIGENKAIRTGTASSGITQSYNFGNAKKYRLKFTISDFVSGAIKGEFIGGGGSDLFFTNNNIGNGTFTFETTTTTNRTALQFYVFSSFQGSITNISVIEITDDTNLPRINYEGFSYQDALGDELVTNGGFDTDSDWVKGAGWSIANGVAIRNGAVSNSYIGQSLNLVSGKTYEFNFTVNSVNGTGSIYTPSTAETITTYTTIGDKKAYFTPSNTQTYILGWYGIGSAELEIDNVSVKEYLGQEVVPNSGCGSWLFEPQSTNLITYSEDFSQWAKVGTPTITSNYSISPDGTQNSTRVEFDANERIYFILSASGDITFSVYLKGSGVITLRDNTNAYRQDVTLTSEWARYDLSFNATITSIQIQNQTASIVDLEIWGAMLEENSYPTSLIPTSGSQVTRNQDVCTNGGSLATINSTEGVLYVEMAALADTITDRSMACISDGTTNNSLVIRYGNVSNTIEARGRVSGTNVGLTSFIVSDETQFHKIAYKWKLNNYALWIDGVEVGTATGAVPSDNTLNRLSIDNGAGGLSGEGKVKALAVWKEALTDSELQSLTTI